VIGRILADSRVEIFAHGLFHFPDGPLWMRKSGSFTSWRATLIVSSACRSIPTALAAPHVFADGLARTPDGVAFDVNGNLYVTTYGSNAIYRVGPDRHAKLLCADYECALLCKATNCAFGGPQFDQLLVPNLGRAIYQGSTCESKGCHCGISAEDHHAGP
jgi:sugar lactone lactonase YvrE